MPVGAERGRWWPRDLAPGDGGADQPGTARAGARWSGGSRKWRGSVGPTHVRLPAGARSPAWPNQTGRSTRIRARWSMPIRSVETISGPSLTGLRCPGVINGCRTPMRSTQGGTASSVRTTIRDVSVRGQRIRVAGTPGLRRGHPAGVVLRPRRRPRGVASTLVDALPAVEVIRFDVPRWGGSPTGPLPYRFGQLTLGLAPGVGRARVRPGRCARILLGRRAGRSSSPHNTRGAAAGWYW